MMEKIVVKPEIVDQRKLLQKGEENLEKGNLDEALRLFQKANRFYEANRSQSWKKVRCVSKC